MYISQVSGERLQDHWSSGLKLVSSSIYMNLICFNHGKWNDVTPTKVNKQLLAGFDLAPPIHVASRSCDNVFSSSIKILWQLQ